tara:strand:+ start:39 stop:149 length:111 start_codon:yes stop_codon:yes gene_type:complete
MKVFWNEKVPVAQYEKAITPNISATPRAYETNMDPK